MIYRTFGRTGLKVSAAGLGGGGFSRLGLAKGKSEADVVSLIRLALDLGVNIIDTAASYGTEPVIGRAIKSVPRDSLVITTKASPTKYPSWELFTPENVVASIERAARRRGRGGRHRRRAYRAPRRPFIASRRVATMIAASVRRASAERRRI
jgi:aryl-alcohol dehydrogenase-like predicted oxidoreductase